MTIYQRMEAAFAAAGVPGFLQAWQKTDEFPEIPPTFCAYVATQTDDALNADDQELARGYAVTVHLYGTADVSAAQAALEAAFLDGGFLIPRIRDLDDVRAGEYRYHKRFDLTYYDFFMEE